MSAHSLVRLGFLIVMIVAMAGALLDLVSFRRPVLLGRVATRG